MSEADAPIDVEAEFIRRRPQLEFQIGKVVHCAETAADLASEMYLKLRRVRPTCWSEGEARTYLFKMARNTAIDHVRTSGRRHRLLGELPDFFEPEPIASPEIAMVAHSDIGIVEGALAELPGKAREMLYLSRVVGLTHGEIAERLDVSKSLIEKYIARALSHCRLRMAEHASKELARESALDMASAGVPPSSLPSSVSR